MLNLSLYCTVSLAMFTKDSGFYGGNEVLFDVSSDIEGWVDQADIDTLVDIITTKVDEYALLFFDRDFLYYVDSYKKSKVKMPSFHDDAFMMHESFDYDSMLRHGFFANSRGHSGVSYDSY